jgi:malate synthase
MADFEDSSSPTWLNMISGQANLYHAVRRTLEFSASAGKTYKLNDTLATLIVRPRGLHLSEKHLLIKGEPIPASLFDFGLFFFHNAQELIDRGSGPYFYLPKLESHHEARYWNDVFNFAQDYMGIARGTIRATVLIETIMAAFQMEEILFELKEHAAGLNAGRWDYIFSFIKRLKNHSDMVLPDRSLITMDVPFMKAYCQRLVEICHRRGAHAMGGMSAFIPNKNDPTVTAQALAKVKSDKAREVALGFDGTWVAHPDLIAVAKQEFVSVLQDKANQKDKASISNSCGCSNFQAVEVSAENLTSLADIPTTVSENGIRNNINVSLQYIAAWLMGRGAVAIHNLMEDAATAEISRAQLWQWLNHDSELEDGRTFNRHLYRTFLTEELNALLEGASPLLQARLLQAEEVLTQVVLKKRFEEFLTLVAYEVLLTNENEQAENAAQDNSINQTQSGSTMTKQDQTQQETTEQTITFGGCIPQNAMARRWEGIQRPYSDEDVMRLRPTVNADCTIARHGAIKLWNMLRNGEQVIALGALNGSQAVQMAKAGLKAIYLSGWQVAADANLAGHTYPDQSLYPSNSVPAVVRRLNNALARHDQILKLEGKSGADAYLPIVADAEAGFGGPLQAYELMKMMIEAGASGVHFEDQLAAEKKCGHMGGKVLVPTSQFINTLAAARMAADVLDVPTIIIARTDALDATLLTSDIDPRDHAFLSGERTAKGMVKDATTGQMVESDVVLKGERTSEGYFRVKGGIESVIARGLAYAPYADVIWYECSRPNLAEAKRFADAIHAQFPGKILAYNCSPSFHWKDYLDDGTIATFMDELGKMGYLFDFITLAGWHSINLSMFKLASEYAAEGMPAYVRLQEEEFAMVNQGYTAVKHQAEVGAGWFDNLLMTITGGTSSTAALKGSTEEGQFHGEKSQ